MTSEEAVGSMIAAGTTAVVGIGMAGAVINAANRMPRRRTRVTFYVNVPRRRRGRRVSSLKW